MSNLEQGSIPGGVAYRRKRGVMDESKTEINELDSELNEYINNLRKRAEAAEGRAAELQADVERLTNALRWLVDVPAVDTKSVDVAWNNARKILGR